MKTKGGRKRTATKLQRRLKAIKDEPPVMEFGDGKRFWYKTVGHGKNVCYRRPGSHK